MNEPIGATISGYDTCRAGGITARASAPVLALCRKLVEAGHDPATPLHAYRGETLALTVSSIGWGARHVVRDNLWGTPVLRLDRKASMAPASPMRLSDPSVHAST
jgi:hypothetical protein